VVEAKRLSAPEAAAVLGVSARRVRQLLDSGELDAEVVGGRALLDADSVYRRLEQRPPAGRPLSPELAWALLAALSLDAVRWDDSLRSVAPDRRLRHRLIRQLNSPHDAQEWRQLLRRRADLQRYWAHPAVVTDLLADSQLSAGRARAASAHGLDVSPGEEAFAYVPLDALVALERRYALEPDPHGAVELMAYDSAHRGGPQPGHPVPVAAAVVDMLDSRDARLQFQASTWLKKAVGRGIRPSGVAS
jgi:excisionase family DNA binding protein